MCKESLLYSNEEECDKQISPPICIDSIYSLVISLFFGDCLKSKLFSNLLPMQKKLTLDRVNGFQIMFVGKRGCPSHLQGCIERFDRIQCFFCFFPNHLVIIFPSNHLSLQHLKKRSQQLPTPNSQSLKYLVKQGVQCPPPPNSSHKSTTQASFDKANAYKK